MILNFELYPGSRITETELAEMFGVSRTPIRAALQRLEAEGYLSVLPKQGCFIRNLDIDELAKYYQVRVALEMLALENACTFMPDAKLRALAAAWDPKHQEDRSADPLKMESRDEGFHLALAEASGNPALAHYLDDINRHIRVIRRLDFTDPRRIDVTYQEHYDICQHLLKRDLPAAQSAMRSHISRSEQFARNLTLTELARKKRRSAGSGASA
jgi:DNA-binding GntR family transcriptional regulator